MTLPAVKAKLLEGKKGLIVGIANDRSIAWGCARAFRALGAELAITYLNEKAKPHVEPLAREVEAPIFMPMDVMADGQLEAVFDRIAADWGELDFLVHSIAFSTKDALGGRVTDVPRDGFQVTMDVSVWSFLRMAHLAEPLMKNGGTLFTMTYYGSEKVVENYNIMGVAKAALECAVRYVAAELGPKGIRVHAISPGPLATRAASGIPEFDALLEKAKVKAPARALVDIDDVGIGLRLPRPRRRPPDHRPGPLHRRRLPHHRLAIAPRTDRNTGTLAYPIPMKWSQCANQRVTGRECWISVPVAPLPRPEPGDDLLSDRQLHADPIPRFPDVRVLDPLSSRDMLPLKLDRKCSERPGRVPTGRRGGWQMTGLDGWRSAAAGAMALGIVSLGSPASAVDIKDVDPGDRGVSRVPQATPPRSTRRPIRT